MLQVAILGASGRMGRELLRLIDSADDLALAGASTERGDENVGRAANRLAGLDDSGIALTDDAAHAVADAQVAIDFTLPAALADNLAACVSAGVPMVIGTTGLGPAEFEQIDAAAKQIPIVYGRNMSIGIAVLTDLVRTAAATLGEDFDIEITEAHHRDKVDAPSGTALQLGEAAAGARGTTLDAAAAWARHGSDAARAPGQIGFQSQRGGRIVGEHSVMLAGDAEILRLEHQALDRAVFARGALRAARWVAGRKPGRFGIGDVIEQP